MQEGNEQFQHPEVRNIDETVPASTTEIDRALQAIKVLTRGGRVKSTSDEDWAIIEAYARDVESPIDSIDVAIENDDPGHGSPILAEIRWRDLVSGSGSLTWQIIRNDQDLMFVKVPVGGVPFDTRMAEYGLGLHDVTTNDIRRLREDISNTDWATSS